MMDIEISRYHEILFFVFRVKSELLLVNSMSYLPPGSASDERFIFEIDLLRYLTTVEGVEVGRGEIRIISEILTERPNLVSADSLKFTYRFMSCFSSNKLRI